MRIKLFKWINSIFNDQNDTFVGLSQLREVEKQKKQQPKTVKKEVQNKDIKLSDLMRGLS